MVWGNGGDGWPRDVDSRRDDPEKPVTSKLQLTKASIDDMAYPFDIMDVRLDHWTT